jgi:hypothetical protein
MIICCFDLEESAFIRGALDWFLAFKLDVVAGMVLLDFDAALHPLTMQAPESAAQSLWYLDLQPGHVNDAARPTALRQSGQISEAMAGLSFRLSAPSGARSRAQ